MKNTVKAIAVILLSFVIAHRSRAQEPRLATLEQQKACADQAKRAFKDSDFSKPDKDPSTYKTTDVEYTSHYSPKINICYIMIHQSALLRDVKDKTDVTFSNSYVVFDAFEGRVYANLVWLNREKDKKKYWEVKPMECNVKPHGQDEIFCKSTEEFEQLVDKHFGIGM